MNHGPVRPGLASFVLVTQDVSTTALGSPSCDALARDPTIGTLCGSAHGSTILIQPELVHCDPATTFSDIVARSVHHADLALMVARIDGHWFRSVAM